MIKLVTRLMTVSLLLIAMFSIVVWAGWYNQTLDLMNLGRHAHKFPLGADQGPIAVALGSLLVAWLLDAYEPDDRAD